MSFFINLDNYASFKQKSTKDIDTWTEKIFCDELAAYLSYIVTARCKSEKLPYLVTYISFGLRIFAALFFFYGMNLQGAIIFYLSMISDSVDGICSRAIFGKDPELRGTLDVMFDVIGLAALLFAIGVANNDLRLLLLIYAIFLYIYEFGAATRYRLYSKLNLDVDLTFDQNLHQQSGYVKKSFIQEIYLKVRNIFSSRGFLFYPTVVDAEFVLLVVAPILGFSMSIIYIAILFCAIDGLLAIFSSIFIISRIPR